MDNQTKVGVGVCIFKNGKVLLGKRKSVHGKNEYAAPGRHLEYIEIFENCAIKETMEKTDMEITNLRFLYLANIRIWKPKHFVHIEIIADWKSGIPQVLEPEKQENWNWYDMNEIPSPLFKSEELAIEAIKTGKDYFDC